MITNAYYSQEGHGPYELIDIGELDLEEGGTIRGCKLAVATYGKLNAAKDNAILVPTWYSGTSKIIEQVLRRPGPRARPRQVLHRRRQPDRQRAVDLAAQRARRTRHGELPEGAHRRRRARPAPAAARDVRDRRASRSSSAARWVRSRPTSGRCASPTRSSAPHRSPAPRRTRRTTSCSPRRSTRRSRRTPAWNGGNYKQSADVAAGLKRHAKMWAVMGWSTEF